MKVDLYPHQIKAIEEIHNGCIVKGGVGVGKSRIAIGYFYSRVAGGSFRTDAGGDFKVPERPLDLYIITTAKKRDKGEWTEEAAHFGLVHDSDLSYGGIKVTVDSWNNVLDYKDVTNAFFIFDEQRLVGAGAWVKAFYKIASKNQWIVLSATPGDNWLDYIPVFVANGYYKNRTEFIDRHVKYNNHSPYPKVDRFIGTGHLEGLRQRILVDVPYPRHTVRHTRNILVEHNVDAFNRVWKDRWNVFEDRPIRDIGELFRVARRLVNSDPSRLGAVMQLMEKHPRLIIFYNFDHELIHGRASCTGLKVVDSKNPFTFFATIRNRVCCTKAILRVKENLLWYHPVTNCVVDVKVQGLTSSR